MNPYLDRYCITCGKRISLAEADLYGGTCAICSVGILDLLFQALLRKLYISPIIDIY